MMKSTTKFTLRTDAELLKQFRYVTDYNARSVNRKLELLMKNISPSLKKNMAR